MCQSRFCLLSVLVVCVLCETIHSNPQAPSESDPFDLPPKIGSAAIDARQNDVAAVEILSKNCLNCHGPTKQEGGLRLDRSEYAILGGDSGAALVPSESASSLLIQFVGGKGDRVMPPEGERLTMEQIDTLSDWIDRGANWPEQTLKARVGGVATDSGIPWSFKPICRPELPIVKQNDWLVNDIDSFVLARLEKEGLSPSPEADRRTLIRRLSIDLRGLPPSDDDIHAFLNDDRRDAYERLVDRYLASPHFGERWSRHWLDRTHYAESSGCLVDLARPYAWRWRDWVVDAINSDLPFDQFTIHQIAGDLLPDANSETRAATGFFRNALTNYEPGIDLVAERAKTVVDRTSTVGAAWLGITLGCAECHSHKFDPISQRDFYRMYAFFDRIDDQTIDAPSTAMSPSFAEEKANYERARSAYSRLTAAGQAEWETRVKRLPDIWRIPSEFDARTWRSLRFAMVHPQADGSFTVDGVARSSDRHIVQFLSNQQTIRAIRIELLADTNRFDLGPGRGKDSHCMLTGITLTSASVDRPLDVHTTTFASVDVDYCATSYDASKAWSGTDDCGWSVDHSGVSHAAVFVLNSPIVCNVPTNVALRLEFHGGRGRTPSRFRIAVTDEADEFLEGQAIPADIRLLVAHDASTLSEDDRVRVKHYFQSTYASTSSDLAVWNSARRRYAACLHPSGAECVQESWQARETRIHLRGDVLRPGDAVKPGIPKYFETEGDIQVPWTRIDFANWLVSPTNPLTARVAVNSFWQPLFGAGLVRTPGDFGNQGQPPIYPELLDWLADQFMRDGWSRKKTIRRVVLSASYRQSSKVSAEAIRNDPANVKLARQTRMRLDAEVLRDCVLDRAGLLNMRMGGPSYRQPQPGEDPIEDWEPIEIASAVEDEFRRGLYIAIARNVPDPFLTTFDAPDGAAVCPIRHCTNTPLQAFALMNDPLTVAAARALSTSDFVRSEVDLRVRIKRLWVHCTGREPLSQELEVVEELFRNVAIVENVQNDQVTPEQAARIWFVIARTILNLDESITRE